MKKLKRKTGKKALEVCVRAKAMLIKQDGFGLNEILGIAAALIIASLIIIPRLGGLAGSIMDGLQEWWNGINGTVFSEKTLP